MTALLLRHEPHEQRDGGYACGLGKGGHTKGFWNKVDKQPGDGCWIWLGARSKSGAGKFCKSLGARGRQRTLSAHRYAWEQEHGSVPAGHLLVASCRTALCVRPSHRKLVTSEECGRIYGGLAERVEQGGEWNSCHILTVEQVRFIRLQASVRGSVPLLAKLFGVSRVTVYAVKDRKTWRSVRGRAHLVELLTLEQLRQLVDARTERQALDDLAVARPGGDA